MRDESKLTIGLSMAKRCDNLDKDFEDSVSALILPEAEASRENPLTRVKGEIAAANSFNASRAILMELADKLELRPKVKKEVELNLEHLGREIIFRGDLQRPKTGARFLVDTHAILLDHYLVLAKSFIARDQSQSAKTAPSIDNFDDVHATLPFESRAKQQTKTKEDIRPYEKYDVSELPIPMDLLVLESTNDDPVIKSSVRDVATVTPQSSVSPLTHTGPGASIKGSAAISENKDEKILFPFKIKHLGKTGTYVLYAFSAQDRANWCQKIIEAKTKHAAALLSQNVEPFRLRVLADTAFEYPDQTSRSESITISGTPLHHAIEEFEKKYGGSELRPPPVCRTGVKCATAFQQPTGQQMCAVGTDYGVWVSDLSKPRDWYQAIPFMRVTQVAVFEEFNILLLISDGSLIAYHLDVVCPASGITSRSQDNVRRVAQKLSGKSEVGFFAAGQMNDRCLIVYKRRDGFSSTFKVLELLIQKSSSSKRLFVKAFRSQSELFREYDEFYIPVESYGINMFRTSFAISTMVGIQVLTLNKKQSWSVPDFKSDVPGASDTLMSIVYRIKNLRALGMFRLSDDEFLIAYQQCGVYVNKYGDVSRSVVMEFVGSAHTACLKGDFLILFNDDFVEVRSAMNGRLKQVIPGHNVVCLDDGSKVPGVFGSIGSTQNTVKICMQHPDFEQIQIVLELVENPDVTY
ncbi:hypothetical protein N7507_009853 [Penicillium longicatenatum]|nr:hypothetical protein N7507_009853 [Penicillium longicatenatum]